MLPIRSRRFNAGLLPFVNGFYDGFRRYQSLHTGWGLQYDGLTSDLLLVVTHRRRRRLLKIRNMTAAETLGANLAQSFCKSGAAGTSPALVVGVRANTHCLGEALARRYFIVGNIVRSLLK